jgi:hypothetical protein
VGVPALVALLVGCATSGQSPSSDVSEGSSTTQQTATTLCTTVLETEESFVSVEEIGEASDAVVVGTVSSVEPLGTADAGEDPSASGYVRVAVDVEESLKGEAVPRVAFAWEAYVTDGNGNRECEILIDRLPVPEQGDSLLLFLVPESDERKALFGENVTHRPNSSYGLSYVSDGVVTTVAQRFEGDLGDTLKGLTTEEVQSSIGS